MSRPSDRSTLLSRIEQDFETMLALAGHIPVAARSRPGACDAWSVKDILAHLDAWHGLFLEWERVGSSGGRPELPAEGYSWKETPALNASIWERTRADPWDQIVDRLVVSHDQVRNAVAAYSEADLFAKRRYPWTGSTSVGSYSVSATTSHYDWATKLMRRFRRSLTDA